MIDDTHIVLATLVVSLILFVTDAVRYEVVALGVLLVLGSTGVLEKEEAYAGFASPAIVLILSMYVFGHAFTRWGIAEAMGEKFLSTRREGPGAEAVLVAKVVLVSGVLSAVLSNTGVVATLIPTCAAVARRHRIPVSLLLMPMSFGSLLGGLVTLIATSKNLVVNGIVDDRGLAPFTLFEFTGFGLILLVAGSLYFLGPGRLLLPRSSVEQTLAERYQVPKFVSEILVEPSSSLINRAVADAELFERYDVAVLGIVRPEGQGSVLAPGPYNRIRPGDTLILQGVPDALLHLREELHVPTKPYVDSDQTRLYSDDVALVEAVVPAGSKLAGSSLSEARFRDATGLNVVAFSKHGHLQVGRLQDTRLSVGDTLLLQGHLRDLERARQARELIVLQTRERRHLGNKARTVLIAMAAVLVLASVTTIPLSMLALWGALALVLTRAVQADEIARAMNWRVIALLGGMFALGNAFSKVGLDRQLGDWLSGLVRSGLSVTALFWVLMVMTTLLTQVLNYITTAMIMTPVAIAIAQPLGLDPRPFLMGVIAASEFAFLSPVAHQCNAMVLGPGEYKYKDFVVSGAPLAAVMLVLSAWLIPVFWPFTPV